MTIFDINKLNNTKERLLPRKLLFVFIQHIFKYFFKISLSVLWPF